MKERASASNFRVAHKKILAAGRGRNSEGKYLERRGSSIDTAKKILYGGREVTSGKLRYE